MFFGVKCTPHPPFCSVVTDNICSDDPML